jgi:hypothetical protein
MNIVQAVKALRGGKGANIRRAGWLEGLPESIMPLFAVTQNLKWIGGKTAYTPNE